MPVVHPEHQAEEGYLGERIRWVIRLRWFAVAGLSVAVVVALATRAVSAHVELPTLVALLGVGNAAATRWLASRTWSRARLEAMLEGHLVLDVVLLAAMLHWSDGVENPFAMLYVFLAAIAGKLLPAARAYRLAALVLVLQGLVVAGEHFGVLTHHALAPHAREDKAIESFGTVVAHLVALGLAAFGVVYFMSSSAARYRRVRDELAAAEEAGRRRARFAELGELAGWVVHSLLNPVQALGASVELVRAGGAQPDPETLEGMEEAIARIRALTSRLRAHSRLEPHAARRVAAAALADEAGRRVSVAVPSATIRVLDDAAGADVSVDAELILEALANVLNNAVEASPPGAEVRVHVRAGSDSVEFAVEDDGAGVSPEDLPRLFDPFFTTKPIGRGTGLGLVLARRTVEAHGGELHLVSELGVGTCVSIRLPRRGSP